MSPARMYSFARSTIAWYCSRVTFAIGSGGGLAIRSGSWLMPRLNSATASASRSQACA